MEHALFFIAGLTVGGGLRTIFHQAHRHIHTVKS